MIKKILAIVILASLTGFFGYGAYLSASTNDRQGMWFFIAALFFPAIPLFLISLHILSAQLPFLEPVKRLFFGPPKESMPVRFVPHQFVMSAILVTVSAVIFILLLSILK